VTLKPDPIAVRARPALPARSAAPAPSAGAIELAPGAAVEESSLRFQYARSRGPGGQNVNKVNSKAELWVAVEAILGLDERAVHRLREIAGKRVTAAGEIHIASDSHRSQEQNRGAVMERLAAMVKAAIHQPRARRKTRPSKAARRRRVDAKRRRGETKSLRRGGSSQD